MSRPARFLLLAALALLAVPAASAGAAELRLENGVAVYRAGPGKANDLSVGPDDFDAAAIQFTDVVPPTVGPGLACNAFSAYGWYFVSCKVAGLTGVRLEAGDGVDTVDVREDIPFAGPITADGGPGNDQVQGPLRNRPVTLLGGAGDDVVNGGYGADVLHGGPGRDVLDGRDGADRVFGDEGDDELAGGRAIAADLLDGGAGVDTIKSDWYDSNGPDLPIAVTLDAGADDGRPGEGDDVRGVERIETRLVARLVAGGSAVTFDVTGTGAGSTTLIGSPGADRLRSFDYADHVEGRGGDDQIEAGNGDDVIDPGPGRDTVVADAGAGSCNFLECRGTYGNDVIHARDGERDSIECGPGNDAVEADAIDVLSNCETVNGRPTGDGAAPGGGGTTGNGSGGGAAGGSGSSGGGKGGTTARKACKVPKVARGATTTTAKRRLRKARCRIGRTTRVRSRTRRGRVVRLSVRSGKRTTKAVGVVVSRGRR